MKLLELKACLNGLEHITFRLPNGALVPPHFHVTEVGKVTKHFIDCGGTERKEDVINFQLWTADDYDHQLGAEKLLDIITLSEEKLQLNNLSIEVEYQSDTIGKYGLDFDGNYFLLTSKYTDCLAKDNCGIPQEKPRVRLSELQQPRATQCSPNSGCC